MIREEGAKAQQMNRVIPFIDEANLELCAISDEINRFQVVRLIPSGSVIVGNKRLEPTRGVVGQIS